MTTIKWKGNFREACKEVGIILPSWLNFKSMYSSGGFKPKVVGVNFYFYTPVGMQYKGRRIYFEKNTDQELSIAKVQKAIADLTVAYEEANKAKEDRDSRELEKQQKLADTTKSLIKLGFEYKENSYFPIISKDGKYLDVSPKCESVTIKLEGLTPEQAKQVLDLFKTFE